MPTVKTCTKCGEAKPLDGFHKDKRKRGARKSRCKECEAERSLRYREENREKIREYKRRYREENREKVLEQKRRYREKNREKIRERDRIYREENQGRKRQYNYENREVLNAKSSSYQKTLQELSKALSSIPPYTPWSEEEETFLMADNGMTIYEKTIHLGRTYESCRHRHQWLTNLRRTTNA